MADDLQMKGHFQHNLPAMNVARPKADTRIALRSNLLRSNLPQSTLAAGLLLALLTWSASAAPLHAAPGRSATLPAGNLDQLGSELATGLRKKDLVRIEAAIEKICAEGSAEAAMLLIEKCVLSGKPEIETLVRSHLLELPDGPAFQWLCAQCTEHKRLEVREQLIQVLTHRTERPAFVALLTALYDRSDGVRVRAIRALGEKDHRGTIPHLIKALEGEYDEEHELGQIAGEIRDVLNRWMGQDLFGIGEFKEVWSRFKDNLLDPETQKKKNPLGEIEWERRGTSVSVKLPAFFGEEIITDRVVFVMDTSISMNAIDPVPEEDPGVAGGSDGRGGGGTSVGGKGKEGRRGERHKPKVPQTRLKRVQNELVRLISDLPAKFEFSIVSFDQDVTIFTKGLQKATKENKRLGILFVRDFSVGGETWTDDALEAAFKVARARTIILLSDGQPYRRKNPIHVPTLLDWAEERNRFTHVEIHTLGFRATSQGAGSFLKQLAKRNHGTYTEIP